MTGQVVDPIPTLPTLCQHNILDGARAYHSPQPLAGPNPRPKSQMHSTMHYTLPRLNLKHEMEGVSTCFSCPCPGTCVFLWRTHHKRELFLSTSCITVLMILPNTRVVTRRTPLSLALHLRRLTSVLFLHLHPITLRRVPHPALHSSPCVCTPSLPRHQFPCPLCVAPIPAASAL